MRKSSIKKWPQVRLLKWDTQIYSVAPVTECLNKIEGGICCIFIEISFGSRIHIYQIGLDYLFVSRSFLRKKLFMIMYYLQLEEKCLKCFTQKGVFRNGRWMILHLILKQIINTNAGFLFIIKPNKFDFFFTSQTKPNQTC